MVQFLGASPKRRVVAAAAADSHTLEAVWSAAREDYIDYLLVGDEDQIRTEANGIGFDVDRSKILHTTSGEEEMARMAVAAVRRGDGDFLMKGKMQTSSLLKAVVNRETGLRGEGVMSHMALLDIPTCSKLLGVTDGGMFPHPTLADKEGILKNAVSFFHALGYAKPKVAALAAAEAVNPKIPETTDAAALRDKAQTGVFGDCYVDGPLSMDLALSLNACQVKNYHSPVAGDADILLTPTMAAGNIMVKGLLLFAEARMAGCIVGAGVPVVLSSRSASASEKFYSLVLSAAICQ